MKFGAVSAVMETLYRTAAVRKELSHNVKLSVYRSVYVPTLTNNHELWVVTKKDQVVGTSGRNEVPPDSGWA